MPEDNVVDLNAHRRKQDVRALIWKQGGMCPYTGQDLDPNTIIILRNAQGEARMALSPDGWAAMTDLMKQYISRQGMTVDYGTETP